VNESVWCEFVFYLPPNILSTHTHSLTYSLTLSLTLSLSLTHTLSLSSHDYLPQNILSRSRRNKKSERVRA